MSSCMHCGTSFAPSASAKEFCCKGCEFVHGLIHAAGLDRFYELRDPTAAQPILDRPFQKMAFAWLEDQQRLAEEEAREENRPASLRLHVQGITCVGCVWLIEKLFRRLPGSGQADVFPSDGRLDLRWEGGSCDLAAFAAELQRFGYAVQPYRDDPRHHSELASLTSRLGLCGAFALNAMVFTLPRYLGMAEEFFLAGIFELISLLSATLALLTGGSFFIVRAWAALRQRVLHIDLPIALGILSAYLGSLVGWALEAERLLYFDFVAIFTFLMLGGRYLQVAATEKVRNNTRGRSPLPREVALKEGTLLPLDALEAGTTYLVESGEVIPVASILRAPSADLSLAWITGEPAPVSLLSGRRVPAGAVNLNGRPIELEAEEGISSSLVATLARQAQSPPRSLLLERILKIYLAAVLFLAAAGGAAWASLARDAVTALQVTLSILVVSCPCALGVALPLLDQRAAAAMQRLGVLVQNPSLWHRLTRIRHLLLDKTGTLTLERPQLTNPATLHALPQLERGILADLAAATLHPLARSLFEAVGGAPVTAGRTRVQELPGLGVRATLATGRWSLGRPGWDGSRSRDPVARSDNLACDFRRDGKLIARFQFVEAPRPQAREALSALRSTYHLESTVLSGDEPQRVKAQAAALGLDPAHAHGGLSPQDKEEAVRAFAGNPTLYLGDGANDSLAFEAATACGAPVSDRSVLDSKADFFFTARGLGFLPPLFAFARWRQRAARSIVGLAIIYNILAIVICLTGSMSPLLAAVLMPLSSLACLALAGRRLPAQLALPSSPQERKSRPLSLPPEGAAAAP